MYEETEQKYVEISNLLLDTENPRHDVLSDQRGALSFMLSSQGEKILNLARDISRNGLNPSELFIVAPHEINENKYVILEGNRRFTAIKLLHQPDLAELSGKQAFVKKFKDLSSNYTQFPEEVGCVIFPSRESAAKWISLRHTGENLGVGIVKWQSKEIARFNERQGKSAPHLKLIDFAVEKFGFSKDDINAIPVTSLKRLISDPDVREFLGFDYKDSEIIPQTALEEISKGLKKVFDDLREKRIKVRDIYKKEDRETYLKGFSPEETPNLSKPADAPPPKPPAAAATGGDRPSPRSSIIRRRNHLIPSNCFLRLEDNRAKNIYWELKKLDISAFPNAVSVLLRVFFEASIDHYLERENLLEELGSRPNLSSKVEKVKNDLKQKKKLTEREAKPINVALSDEDNILSIHTLHAFVHNPHFPPEPRELKGIWDRMQGFMEKIWS